MGGFDPEEYLKKQKPSTGFNPDQYLEENGTKKKTSLPDSGNGVETSGPLSATGQFDQFNPVHPNPFVPAPTNVPKETPLSYKDKLGHAALAGIDMLGGMVSNIPSSLVDMGIKLFGNQPGGLAMQGVDAEELGKITEQVTGLPEAYNPLSPNNIAATTYAARAQKNQELANEGYEGGILGALKDKKYGQAGKLAAMGIVESLPVTIGLIATRAGGISEAASLGGIFGLGTQGQTYTQLKKDHPDMDQNTLYLNSVLTGVSEAGSELIGTNEIYNQAQRIFKAEGKKAGEEVLRKGLRGYFDAAFKKFFVGVSSLDEGTTEAINQITNNAIDKWTGVKPDVDYTDGAFDSFVVGLGAGAGVASLFHVLDKISEGKIKKKQALADKIIADLDLPEITPEAHDVLMDKLHQTNEELNDLHEEAQKVATTLTPEQKAKTTELSSKIDELSSVMDDPAVSAPVKNEIKTELDDLHKELKETIKPVNEAAKQRLLDELETDLESMKKPDTGGKSTIYYDEATNTIKEKEPAKPKNEIPTEIAGFKVTGEAEPAGGERVFTVDDNGTERFLTADGKELKVNKNEQTPTSTTTADEVQQESAKTTAPVNSEKVASRDIEKIKLNAEELADIDDAGIDSESQISSRNVFKKPYDDSDLPNVEDPKLKSFINDENNIEQQEVNISDLVPTQRILDKEAISDNLEKGNPFIIKDKQGRLLVVDGHHRIANEFEKGKDTVLADVVDISKINYPTYEQSSLDTVKENPVDEVDQEEIDKQIAPVADEMAKIENEFSNRGFDIDKDHDEEITITNKKTGDMLTDASELPEDLHDMAGKYEEAVQKLSPHANMGKLLKEARDRFKGEDVDFEDVKNELPPAKTKREKIDDDIDEAFKDFAKSIGKSLGSSGLSSESIEKGIKLVGLYTKKGIYKFSDMVEDAHTRFGEAIKDIIDAMKVAYVSHTVQAEDEVADKMTEARDVRKFNFDEYLKNKANGTEGNGVVPNTVRDNKSEVDGTEQPAGIEGAVQGKQTEAISGKDSGESVQDAGGSGEERNEGGRSTGSDQPGTAGTESGRGSTNRSTKSKGTDVDNGRSGPVDEADNNFVIPEGMNVVPEGAVAKVTSNMNSMLLLNELEEEKRNPTQAEKEQLAKFVGWGGLASYLEGETTDDISKAIFSGKSTKIGYYSGGIVDTGKPLNVNGRSFEDIVNDFRKAYQEVIKDQKLLRYAPAEARDNVPLDFARKQVIANLLSEEELNAAKVSTENAHYTEGHVIRSMWDLAKHLGFEGGTVLESSAGIGHFFGMMPENLAKNSQGIGVELDNLTGRMMKKLYPENQTFIKGFQDVHLSNNSVDLAIGNVPFASTGRIYDSRNKDISKFSLHNYFIAKNLRLLKPGGVAILITSKATMDNASSAEARRWFASLQGGNSDLIGAVRLPNNAFSKNAGTQVTTDVLVFRKRSSDIAHTEPFFSTVNVRSEMVEDRNGDPQKADIDINEYYIQHPENMIGKMMFAKEAGTGGLYSEYDPTLKAEEGTDVMARLKDIFNSMPKDIYKIEPVDTQEKQAHIMSTEKSGKIFLDKKGELYISNGDEAIPADLKYKTHKDVVKEYIPLRDAVYPLLEAELNPKSTDAEIEEKRKTLNKAYDAFAKKHGNVVKHSGWLFPLDIDYPLVAALENVKTNSHFNEAGKLIMDINVTKGDMLTQRVNYPISIPSKADNYTDAVKISVSYKGYIDPEYIATLMGTDADEVKKKLIKENLAFENPTTGLYETNEAYLSGPVITKLEQAKDASQENSAYQRNVDALEEVQPKKIPAGGIDFKIGVSYLPADIYEKFIEDTLGVDAKLNFVPTIGQWEINPKLGMSNAKNTQTYAVQGVSGLTILSDAMTNRSTTIWRWISKDKKVIDEADTSAASDMQSKINDEFQRYVKGNEKYRETLEQEYNKRFNNYVEPKTQLPTFKHYPGAVNTIQLREHQMKAVLRALTKNTLLAHEVGSGKTFTLVTIAMEMRRLGLAKKPMMVVKNSTLNDFAASFKKLYPTSKILVLSRDEINAKNRKLFFGRIPSGDWDAVIIPHSQFDMIPDRPERVMGYMQEKIAELQAIAAQTNDRFLEQRIEKEIEALNKQMDMVLLSDQDKKDIKVAGESASKGESGNRNKSRAKKEGERIARMTAAVQKITDRKTDNILDFEDMGVDALLMDEFHSWKRLGFSTNIQKVKGIDIAASKKAVSAYLKIQAVMERTGGKNITTATGTPVTNTMAELWTNMRYLIPETLKDMGIQTFDQFQQTFTEISDSIEQNAGGNFEAVQRLSTFYNLPELIKTFRSFADVVTTDDIPEFKQDPDNAPPHLKTGKVQTQILPMTDTLKQVMLDIRNKYEEYKAMSGQEKREHSYIPLLLYYIGKVAPIDPRLINPRLADDPGSKANAAVKEVLRLYKEYDKEKATQMVFSDAIKSSDAEKIREILNIPRGGPEFNLYEDIRNKLIQGGIPANEIAILTDSKYDNDAAKKKLFDLVNEGIVRVIIGSTEKMGVGVNAQERMIGLHHIDAPGRPDMFTQRNGRIIRQGNSFAKSGVPVEVMAYGMEGTRDATAFQRLEKKQGFITQLFKGDITERRSEDAAAEEQDNIDDFFAELGASLSGNKDALKLVMVKKDLRKEENREYSHRQRLYDAENSMRNQERAVTRLTEDVKTAKEVLKAVDKNFPTGELTSVTINGEEYNEKISKQIEDKIITPVSDSIKPSEQVNTKSATFKLGNLDVIVKITKYKGDSKMFTGGTSLNFTIPELHIGTDDDNDSYHGNGGRYVPSASASGMLAMIRSVIEKSESQPARWEKLLNSTKQNIEQLKEDLKATYDETRLNALRKEKRKLDARLLSADKGIFSYKKLDDDNFYVYNNLEDSEVKNESGDVVYYSDAARAQQEAKHLNDIEASKVEEEEIEDPHANIKPVLDFLDNAKIQGGKTLGLIVPIPPAIFNGAIDIIKTVIKAGNTTQKAIAEAIKYLRANGMNGEQIEDFTSVMTKKLARYAEVIDIEPEQATTTSRNEDVAAKREVYGFDRPAPRRGTTEAEFEAQAEEAIKGGYDVYALMDRIIEERQPVSGWEETVLTKFQATKEAELIDIDKKIENNPGMTEANFTKLSDQRDKIIDDMQRSYDASEMSGTVASDALRARKVRVSRDMSLTGMFVKMRKAAGGAPLTAEEISDITRQYQAMQESLAKEKALNERLSEENNKLKAKLEIKRIRAQRKSATIAQLKEEQHAIIADWKEALRASSGLSATVVPYLDKLIISAPYIARFTKNLVDMGATEIKDIVSKIHAEFSDEFPEITERDILDVLAGKYNKKHPTKQGLMDEMTEIKKQAELITKIQDAERGLLVLNPAKRSQASDRIQELKAYLDNLIKDDKNLATRKDNIRKRIQELRTKLTNEDFEKPEKRTPKEDAEYQALRDEYMKAEFDFNKALGKKELENRTKKEKVYDSIADIMNIPRSLLATADFSAVFNQGLVLSTSHPIISAKAAVEMLRQATSQKRYDRWLFDLKKTEGFDLMQKSGLYISDIHNAKLSAREEQFMSNIAERLPIVGSGFTIKGVKIPGLNIIKGSERAYTSFLNKLRADVFMQMVRHIELDGHTFENRPDLYKAAASFINNASGRGGLGKLEPMAPILNSVLFSPRLLVSRINLLNPMYYTKMPKEIRKMALKDMAVFGLTALIVMLLYAINWDPDDNDDESTAEFNPISSDFGKVKIGNTRYNTIGSFAPLIRYSSQFGVAATSSLGQSVGLLDQPLNAIKTSNGNYMPISKDVFPYRSPVDVPIMFLRSKLAPVPSMAWNLLDRQDMIGRPYGIKDIPKSFIPLYLQDTYAGVKDQGPEAIFTIGVPALFGVPVQTY